MVIPEVSLAKTIYADKNISHITKTKRQLGKIPHTRDKAPLD